MAKIYKKTDRIPVKVDDVEIKIAPLSLDQKTEAQEMMAQGRIQKSYKMLMNGIIFMIKHSLKEVSGLKNLDGSVYRLEFENDILTENCVDDLFNIQFHKKLVLICSALSNGVPDQFTDEKGNPIEGVEILPIEQVVSDPN